ncbi:PIN domain-like protein, partial [Saccharata proteae CBS 121410]
FEILGDGEIVSLAELSDEYYRRHGRPLRVAVDEAGWRFSNLTDQQVAIIRKKEPAANPIEKAILYRILKLLKLNIHLLFIFDGNRRPWKRGRAAGRIDWKRIRLLKQLLTHLGVPFHTAPAEAEAECASLQQEGVVDAVWSEDSDSLMFGATLLIR